MDALTLAERLDLHELASEAITTLSGLKKSGPKEGLRAALADAVARAEASGALSSELRARYLLGRSFEDFAEFDETELWFRSAIDRAVEAGTPFAPYGFESRWQLAWVYEVQGRWDETLALTDDFQGTAPRRSRGRCWTRCGSGSSRPAALDVDARARGLRKFWARDGGVAINAASVEMDAAGLRGDAAGAVEVYDEVVAVLSRIWHEWFSARIRLGAVTIGAVARAMPNLSAAERASYIEKVDRIHADGHIVAGPLLRPVRPLGSGGPGLGEAPGRRDPARPLAGRRRRAAAGRAGRHLARRGRALRGLRARLRAGPGARPPWPGSCARPATWPAPASWATWPARPRTCSAPSRCSTSSARSAAPRSARTTPPTRSRRARARSSRWSPRAGRTARSASSCSSARRRSRSTSRTSSASSTPPAAPRPPRSPAAGG